MQTEYNFGNYESATGGVSLETFMAILTTYSLILTIVSILYIVELWLVFKKCGKKGWYSIIPFLNTWTLFDISGLPGWLSLVPVANLIGLLVVYFKLPKRFGKGVGFGIGMLFLPYIFMGILAFSKSKETNTENTNLNSVNPVMDVPGEIAVKDDNANNNIPDLLAPPSESEITEAQNINNNENNLVEAQVLSGLDLTNDEANTTNNDIMQEAMTPQISEEENVNNEYSNAFLGNTPAFGPVEDQNNQSNHVETLEMTMVSPEPLINQNNMGEAINQEVPTINNNPNEGIQSNQGVAPAIEQMQPSNPTNLMNENTNNEMKPFSNTETIDSLESTFEIPKIPNEMINEDITSTKKCKSCGTENPYVNKTCITCGANLE